MSLRYAFPAGATVNFDERELRQLPMTRAPTALVYNGAADADDFIKDLEGKPYCTVCGPTGVGKSTVLPKVIAVKTRKLVIVVTGHPLLALQGYEYFVSHPEVGFDGRSLRATLVLEDVETDLSAYDIVWMSAAALVCWIGGKYNHQVRTKPLNDVIIMLDEAHEADAYTHVIRTVTPHMGIHSLLLVSATFEVSGHKLPDKVRVEAFDIAEVPKTWDVHERGKPWAVENITDSALIYVENDYDAARLVNDYVDAGLRSYRLTSRSTVEEFVEASVIMRDLNEPPTVLVVDGSYRSGFNFDVQLIIDGGFRYLADGTVGVQAVFKRPIFNIEFAQTAGRGGRFKGKTTYYMPELEPEWQSCTLEPVEAEAAAMVTVGFGFYPHKNLQDRVFANEYLPEGVAVVDALNSPAPLTTLVYEPGLKGQLGKRLVPPRPVHKPQKSTVSSDKGATISVTSDSKATQASRLTTKSLNELNRRMGLLSTPTQVWSTHVTGSPETKPTIAPDDSVSRVALGSMPKDIPGFEGTVADVSMVGDDDVWSEVLGVLARPVEVEVVKGNYLYSPNLRSDKIPDSNRYFPEGERSLMKLAAQPDFPAYVIGLGPENLEYALYKCLCRYNLLNSETTVMKRCLVDIYRESVMAVGQPTLRRLFEPIIDQYTAWEIERGTYFNIIKQLSGDKYTLLPIHDRTKFEASRYDNYIIRFRSMLESYTPGPPRIDDWIGQHRTKSGELMGRLSLQPATPAATSAPLSNRARRRLKNKLPSVDEDVEITTVRRGVDYTKLDDKI